MLLQCEATLGHLPHQDSRILELIPRCKQDGVGVAWERGGGVVPELDYCP